MVLEDDMLVALDVQMTLESHGFGNVVVCQNVTEAIEHMKSGTPDAAVLDIFLSHDQTSEEVVRELSARECPYVFLTSATDLPESFGPFLEKAGRVQKPFVDQELVRAVDRLLAQPFA
jgi:two-component SAPR family response regulator